MSNTEINTTAARHIARVPGQRKAWGGGGTMGKIGKDVESVSRPESSLSQQQVLKVHG